MYPKIVIDINKFKINIDRMAEIVKSRGGCSMAVVTKGICADPEIVKLIASHPQVDYIADSRIKNIKTYKALAEKMGKETLLLRLPMECEIEDVIKYADISLNSELTTLELLNAEAGRQNKIHKAVLMIDMGDLREGIFYKNEDEILKTAEEIYSMGNIELSGVGVNLTCYGAIIPKYDNLQGLVKLGEKIEKNLGIKLSMISGGNSSSVYLIEKGDLPERINNLRLGESVLLGNETAYGDRIEGTVNDAVILEAQIVELKTKPSLPIGEKGMDAFGKRPEYEDRGMMSRAIIAIGKQDTDPDGMIPLDDRIEIMGGSSDHIILNVSGTEGEYKVGDKVSFRLNYSALLKCMTSPYVEREYKARL